MRRQPDKWGWEFERANTEAQATCWKNEEPMGEVEVQFCGKEGTEKRAEQPMKGGNNEGT